MMIHFKEYLPFTKDLKGLSKKYRSLPEDLVEFKRILSTYPLGAGGNFTVITIHGAIKIVKARLACRYLKGKPRLRIIYAYHESLETIEFVELYFKGDQTNHDQERLASYLNDCCEATH